MSKRASRKRREQCRRDLKRVEPKEPIHPFFTEWGLKQADYMRAAKVKMQRDYFTLATLLKNGRISRDDYKICLDDLDRKYGQSK